MLMLITLTRLDNVAQICSGSEACYYHIIHLCDVHRQYYRQQEHDHNTETQNCKKTNGGQAQGRRKRNSQVWQEKEETGKEERSIRQSGFQIDGWVFQS